MLSFVRTFSSLALVMVLAACGTNPSDRAVSGAGIGAGAGAVGAALINVNPITGAATNKDELNMGEPFWK
jgi:osmotically inducible lipoprotein OsmB